MKIQIRFPQNAISRIHIRDGKPSQAGNSFETKNRLKFALHTENRMGFVIGTREKKTETSSTVSASGIKTYLSWFYYGLNVFNGILQSDGIPSETSFSRLQLNI